VKRKTSRMADFIFSCAPTLRRVLFVLIVFIFGKRRMSARLPLA
jgi:hypothetical protein